MELTPLSFALLLLSSCSMARGQEETSTSQVGRRIPKCVQVVGFVCRFYMSVHVHPTYFLNKYFFVQEKAGEVDW